MTTKANIGTSKTKVVQKYVNTCMDMWFCTRGQIEKDKLRPCTNTQLEQSELMSFVMILFNLILVDQNQGLCKQGQRNYGISIAKN